MNEPSASSRSAAPDVSIMIVGYNSANVIDRCVASIAPACTGHSYETLLVDQGDGQTAALVAARFPEVAIIPSRGNIGFAAGNNLLAAAARGKYLLLLNPDVELTFEAVDRLLEAAGRHSEASAWGGITLDRSGAPDVGNTVHVPSLGEMVSRVTGRSSAGLRAGARFDTDERAEVLSGGFVLISRSAWDEAGGLDERYFLYCEEVDFFYRLAQRGHSFWRIADARAYHDIGHGEVGSPMRMLYRAAGTMQFARIHWPRWRETAAFLLIWIGALQRYGIGTLLGRWRAHFRAIALSNRQLALRPDVWRHGYDPQRGLLAKLAQKPV
ncbi:glycosyltransferase family 2 protein [Qipengyuania sp. ASV99]|uniref:glycosyltransferase family 2 protein n=1 Tax=Qipengyuania sp. ASV99 TaxID=3399681 RepID=UPI003A4C524F